MDSEGYIIKMKAPCNYCGNKEAEIEFDNDGPYIVIFCTNCNCRLNCNINEIVEKFAKEYWKKRMNNTVIKKRHCPLCNQDWGKRNKVEFTAEFMNVMNGDDVAILCLNCRVVYPFVKLNKEEISTIETQNDYEEIIKDKIIKIALTKNYEKE